MAAFISNYWREGTCLDDNGRLVQQDAANDRDDLRNIFAVLNDRDDRMRGARNGALFLGGLILLAYFGPRVLEWMTR